MKAFSVKAICAAILICGIWTSAALALTTKSFQGECIGKYNSWKKQGGYGAAAIAKNGHCGFAWDYGNAEEARRKALSSCRHGGKGKGCVVVAEKKGIASRPSVVGTAETFTMKAFQDRQKLSTQAMRKRFGGIGRIRCPWGSATTFLIADAGIFITSDHLFVSMKKNAPDLGRADKCTLEFFYSKGRYKIKQGTLIHGFRTNKSAFNFIGYDWAIGRLDRSVDGVQPYAIATGDIGKDSLVTMVSQGTNDFIPRVCIGNVSAILKVTNVAEFTTNCSAGPGTSGGPIVAGGLDGINGNWHSVIGLTRGSVEPYYAAERTFSESHVAIPVEDAEIRKAIDSLLKNPTPTQ